MAEALTIARPYAKALFSEALASGQLQSFAKVLDHLALLTLDHRIKTVIINPELSTLQLTKLFASLLESLDASLVLMLGKTLQNFLQLLVEEKRLSIVSSIATLYRELLMKYEDTVEAEVISAFPLKESHREQIRIRLEKRFNAKVQLNLKEDSALIGGVMIRVGSFVIDGTVTGKLKKMAESLRW